MTTTEQAKQVSQLLRSIFISENVAAVSARNWADAIDALVAENEKLRTLVTDVHKAKGRYHSQLAMCALYEAVGLPNVKPISGEKS